MTELYETEPGVHTVLEIFHLVSWTLTERASRAQVQGPEESGSLLCFTWKISPKQTQNDSKELKNDHKQTQNERDYSDVAASSVVISFHLEDLLT